MKLLYLLFLFTSFIFGKSCAFTIKNESDFTKLSSQIIDDKCTNIAINISSGNFVLNQPIELNIKKIDGITIKGQGMGSSRLLVENKKGAIVIKLKQKKSVVTVRNLSILAKNSDIKNAISILQPNGGNQHRRNVVLKDIEIANLKNKGQFFFKNAIYLKGVWRPLLENIFITGHYGPQAKKHPYKMETCFYLDEVYSPSVVQSRCWSSKIGLNLISNLNPGPEGLVVDHSKFVETLIGINIDFISQEPGAFITNNHINASNIGMNIKNRKFLNIQNNLMYAGIESEKYIDINCVNVDYSNISNNIFHYPSKQKPNRRKEIHLTNSHSNIISNNLFTKKTKKVYGNVSNNSITNNYVTK